jgi:SPP1 Gp6-like portal protein
VKLSDLTDEQWFARLNTRRVAGLCDQEMNWAYYDGEQPMHYVARIIAEQQDRFPALKVNWPGLVIDSLEERLDVEGFRLGDSDSVDDDLVGTWQANDLDEGAPEAHTCALVTRHSFLMGGPGEGRYPKITVEYPDQMSVELDPVTRRVVAALKVWRDDPDTTVEDRAVLLVPNRLIEFEYGKPVHSESTEGWTAGLQHHQSSPLVPVVPMVNRPSRRPRNYRAGRLVETLHGYGRSEIQDIRSLADAANQTATNMMAGIEHHALPRRWAVGAKEKDFVDEQGKPMPAWKIATGALWAATAGEDGTDVKLGQFTGADMTGFHNSIKQLAQLAAGLYGLPPHYLGLFTDNPASADAIRSAEIRLIKRAERRQTSFGGSWERIMRIALAIMGRDPASADRLETVWRDPSTPTRAQQADAAVKLHAEGLVDDELGQEMVGLTIAQRQGMARRRAGAGVRVPNASDVIDRVRNVDVTGSASNGVTPPVNGSVNGVAATVGS